MLAFQETGDGGIRLGGGLHRRRIGGRRHLDAAAQLALEYKQLSTSFLQRKLRLGYSRASRIVDTLESEGLISEADGSKPRQLLMTKEEWEKHIADSRGESV